MPSRLGTPIISRVAIRFAVEPTVRHEYAFIDFLGSEGSLSVVQDVDIEYSLTESFHQLLHIIQAAPDLAASTSMKARTGLS
jgi:hypothetical protein